MDGSFCVAGEGEKAPLSLLIEPSNDPFNGLFEERDTLEDYELQQGCLPKPSAYKGFQEEERLLEWRRKHDATYEEPRNVIWHAMRDEKKREFARKIGTPIGYFSLLNPDQELPLIVANSAILRGGKKPAPGEFSFVLEYLRPTVSAFEDVLKTWPKSDNAPEFAGNVPIRIDFSDRFLHAQADRKAGSREILMTPALLRSFFAMCAAPIYSLVEMQENRQQCSRLSPPFGLSESQVHDYAAEICGSSNNRPYPLDPHTCISREKAKVCMREMDGPDRSVFLNRGIECVKEQASFWIAHELSHVFLRHNNSKFDTEAQADDCAIRLIDGADIGFSGRWSFQQGLFPFMGKYPDLFLGEGEDPTNVVQRVLRITNRDQSTSSFDCMRN